MPVWDRLCADAGVRRTLPRNQGATRCEEQWGAPPVAGSGTERRCHSGFVINNSSGREEAQEQRRREQAESQAPALDALHMLTLKSYKKKFPMDFMAACRPRAKTTNQTLRMMGLYEEDGFFMAKMGAQPPVGVTAGAFLPDMRKRNPNRAVAC
ncbi:hypothetical protein MNEG_9185 [Monoraphidium neglectum]|uniref:Uncharacterized protein n=1 Tax=Monoraphidium neglectum TaxID=145388 RepID=A0A0D2MDE2_9CHLO|nr:hypothetical protein MNEG_9185 [Monoraphidium neglectum]KIY98776.1 hypothetical protein MNEG_9185 [Monoraphidium neglectum]|eukprot:XP_013897796.1 hypothetical protein MNEG_9185 [Monoraphidium neglectum]